MIRKQAVNKSSKELLNLQQKVTITGLGSQAFAKCASALDQLVNVLRNATPSDALPTESLVYEGYSTITFQNRFLLPFHSSSKPTANFIQGIFLNANMCPIYDLWRLPEASMTMASSRNMTHKL
jgi:hypothetical protein